MSLRAPFGHLAAALGDPASRLILAALVLLLAAFVMPRIDVQRETYEYIVVFDITQSMNVTDYELDGVPVSRLTFAREAVRRALGQLPCGSRIGWGVFAEYRSILLLAPVEVCDNYDDLVASLAQLDGRMRWSNASEITKGVYWAMRAAKQLESRPNVMFISDGQEAPPLDPDFRLPLFEDLEPGEVQGWLIGAGGEVPRPIPKSNEEGETIGYWRSWEVIQQHGHREHLSAVRETHLRALAKQIGFDFRRMSDANALLDAMRDPRFARQASAAGSSFWLPALLALGLLAFCFRPDVRSRPRTPVAAREA